VPTNTQAIPGKDKNITPAFWVDRPKRRSPLRPRGGRSIPQATRWGIKGGLTVPNESGAAGVVEIRHWVKCRPREVLLKSSQSARKGVVRRSSLGGGRRKGFSSGLVIAAIYQDTI